MAKLRNPGAREPFALPPLLMPSAKPADPTHVCPATADHRYRAHTFEPAP
jgi:hypothetical protein